MSESKKTEQEQRRDELLKRLLKTPPQPRPKKGERDESVQPKRKKAKKTPDE